MDDGLRVAVSNQEVRIFQNAGDPDYPDDEICISMTREAFERIVLISELAFGVRPRSRVAAPKDVVPSSADTHFDEFWRAYPKKTAKEAARKAWASVKAESVVAEIMGALAVISTSDAWTKDAGKYIPHAATWLNGKRWQDVVEQEFDLGVIK